MSKTIHKGCEYWCVHRKLPQPTQCVVISITTEIGKSVGVEFSEKYTFTHNLDGKCPSGKGLWVTPHNLLTNEEYKEKLRVAELIEEVRGVELESIDVDNDSRPITLRA